MGEFPSGQRGQTVNLLALPSVVRIHLPPPIPDVKTSGIFVYLKGFCCFSIIYWSAICISYKLYHNYTTTPFFASIFYDVFVVLCSRFFVWGNHRQCSSLISPACNRSACRLFQLGDMEKWKKGKKLHKFFGQT